MLPAVDAQRPYSKVTTLMPSPISCGWSIAHCCRCLRSSRPASASVMGCAGTAVVPSTVNSSSSGGEGPESQGNVCCRTGGRRSFRSAQQPTLRVDDRLRPPEHRAALVVTAPRRITAAEPDTDRSDRMQKATSPRELPG